MKLKQHHIKKLKIIYNRVWYSTGNQQLAYAVLDTMEAGIKDKSFNYYYYSIVKSKSRDDRKVWTKKQALKILQRGIDRGLIKRPSMVYDRPKWVKWQYQGAWDILKSYETPFMMENRGDSPNLE